MASKFGATKLFIWYPILNKIGFILKRNTSISTKKYDFCISKVPDFLSAPCSNWP